MTVARPSPGAATPLRERVRVRVPCSTSNVGGGFDCVGIALDRWLEAEAWLDGSDAAPRLERRGTLAALDAAGVAADDDLLVRGLALACAARRVASPRGLVMQAASAIPVARGLGSSAAGLVGGLLVADALLGLELGSARILEIAATEEGHPDNVAPMVLGAAVLGVPRGEAWTFARLEVHEDVAIVLGIPEFPTETRAMRAALPATVAHADAVRAAGKAAALVRGLATADAGLLAWALDDVVHVPYRRALIAGYDDVEAAAVAAGAWGATLSGAGSAMLALAPRADAPRVGDAMAGAWARLGIGAESWLAAIADGARVEVLPPHP